MVEFLVTSGISAVLPVHDLAADGIVDVRVIHDSECFELALDSSKDADRLLVVITSENDLRFQQQAEVALPRRHAFSPTVQRVDCWSEFGNSLWCKLYWGGHILARQEGLQPRCCCMCTCRGSCVFLRLVLELSKNRLCLVSDELHRPIW